MHFAHYIECRCGEEGGQRKWCGAFFLAGGLNNTSVNALFSLISISMWNELASWRRNSGFYFLLLEWLRLTNLMEWLSKWGTTVDEIKNRYSMRFFFVSRFFVLSFLGSVILALMSSISAVWPTVVVHLPTHLSGLSSATNIREINKDGGHNTYTKIYKWSWR